MEVCNLSGGRQSFFLTNSLGGESVAMLADGGHAALLSPSGSNWWAILDVRAAV